MRRLSPVFVRLSPLSFALVVPLLLTSARPLPTGSLAATRPDGSSAEVAQPFQPAAAALRLRRCAAALQSLSQLAAGGGKEAGIARVAVGLYAHACEQTGTAEARLFAASDPDGPLEDWRLYLLADSAAANGHGHLAEATLARLLGDYPASPLRARAFVRAVRLAADNGDPRRAVQLLQRSRSERLPVAEAAQLEVLAWEIGGRTGDGALQLAAARRLLVLSPPEASRLQVIERFRRPDGLLDWTEILTAQELGERARTLLDLSLAPSALLTLDAVQPADRKLAWQLLEAEALTALHRGEEALALLANPAPAADLRERAGLEWARAQAATDIATAQRGRVNRPSAERQTYRLLAHQQLEKTVEIGGDPALSKRALKLLFADQVEAELFDRAIASLKRLRALDPADVTGSDHLWQRGWGEYAQRNYTGAIGTWAELFDLYQGTSNARRGRYWMGRAYDALGERERAQQIYAEVAGADTADLYRRNAQVRLARTATSEGAERAARAVAESWPDDPTLRRARLLTDLGLDQLARTEMELVAGAAQPRARAALDSLVLSRTGDRRRSMVVIRDAFPALASPHQAGLPDLALRLYYPLDHQDTIRTWAEINRLPSFLVYGIIRQESAFDTGARSWAGARGLMQLMPGTARELAGKIGVPYSHDKLSDPAFNVRLGTTYFRQVLSMFDENLELALAGYNGGPYRIKRLWREGGGEIDSFLEGLSIEESRTYVKRILVLSDSYRQLYPTAS